VVLVHELAEVIVNANGAPAAPTMALQISTGSDRNVLPPNPVG
jgi:hypothetical protein